MIGWQNQVTAQVMHKKVKHFVTCTLVSRKALTEMLLLCINHLRYQLWCYNAKYTEKQPL